MRNYTNTAWVANIETGEGFRVAFPMTVAQYMDALSAWHELESHSDCSDVFISKLDGFYGLASVYNTLGELDDIAERIEALEDDDAEKLEAMVEYCDNLDDIEGAWDYSYFFANTTLADYAELHAEECGYLEAVPDFIRGYIDWEDMAEDMKIGASYREINGGVLYVAS